jgi:riboflavin transporter FmnP
MLKLFQAAKENLSFLGVCVLIFAAVFAVAFVIQRKLLGGNIKKVTKARAITFIGMFSAVSGLLMLLEIPLFFAPGFYKLDLSEIPVLICGFYLGPVAGVITELIKIIIKLVLKGTSTAFVGDFANFCVGVSMVLPAAIVYHIRKTKRGAIFGMACGALIMTAFGSFFNAVYLLPTFSSLFGMPMESIIAAGKAVNPAINNISTFVLFAVVPFNLLKGIIDGAATYLLYKRVEKIFFREKKTGV